MRTRWTAAAMTALAAMLLAGCTDDPDPAPTPTLEAVAPSPAPSPTALGFPPCLVGTWTATGERLQPVYDAIPLELDYPDAAIDPAATATLVFDDEGGFLFAQNVPVDLSWQGSPASVRLIGTMSGTTEADGTDIALSPTVNGLEVRAEDDRTGSALFAAATQETLAEWPVAASGYTCGFGTITLDLWTEGWGTEVTFDRAE